MERFIKKKIEVQEDDKKQVFAKGERREDYAAAWKTSDRVFLAGLPGAGRQALATMLAQELGMTVEEPADADALRETCAGQPAIVVVRPEFFEDDDLAALMNRSGKVFYMMADAQTLANRVVERDGSDDPEALWETMSQDLARLEPRFMGSLHFILQAANRPGDLVKDALEKISW